MFGGLSPEQITGVIGAAVALVLGLLAGGKQIIQAYREIREELRVNTRASLNASATADEIQKLQVDRGRLDYLEMWYNAFQLSSDCEGCKASIAEYFSKRSLRAGDNLITQRMMREFNLKHNPTEGQTSDG